MVEIRWALSIASIAFLAGSFASAQPVETIFTSIAGHDGYVLEVSEDAKVGGMNDNSATSGKALRVGDGLRDRQFISILSFDTSPIPDCADVVSARLELTRNGNSGSNPFKVLGDMLVDVHPGAIGGSPGLQGSDFQFKVDYPSAAVTGEQGGNLSVFKIDIDPEMLNVEGLTQMRLRFEKADNDNGREDYAGFYSGENVNSARRPRLVVAFTCPCEVEDTDTDTDTNTSTDTRTETDMDM